MEIRLARFISYLLHPLLLPTYATFLLLNLPFLLSFALSTEAKIWLVVMVFGFTYLLPVAVILTLYYFRLISSIELEDSRERALPLLMTAVSTYTLLYLLRKSGLPEYFLYFIYGALITILAGLLISLKYKISIHMLGWGSAVAMLIGIALKMGIDIPVLILSSVVASGLVGYARLKLNAHNPAQVYLGFLTGAFVILIVTFFI